MPGLSKMAAAPFGVLVVRSENNIGPIGPIRPIFRNYPPKGQEAHYGGPASMRATRLSLVGEISSFF